jgi:hypothetical protein
MPLARIVASNPGAARETALALRQAGYKVEIVPPGTPPNANIDLEFDADSDKVISQKTEESVAGEREFVLKPLWRKLSARYQASRDVARAQQLTGSFSAATVESRAAAPAAPERHEERAAEEAAFAVAELKQIEKEEARRAEQLRLQRERDEQAATRERELASRRVEELRLQRVRQQEEAARQSELAAQRAETQRQAELRRQQELSRQREYEQQQLARKQQEEERGRLEAARRAEEAEALRQAQVAREREELRQQEALRRKTEEEHRLVVMRKREEEERERRAAAQELLLVANKQKEESARLDREPVVVPEAAAAVPTLRQYASLRWSGWKSSRSAAREARPRSNVTRIDHSPAFAWRQAWPITATVAAAFLLGWGIAAYHSPVPKAVTVQPPILAPGQYAPYPVAANAVGKKAAAPAVKPVQKRRVVHDNTVAEDEVVVHHYYPSKASTAQNRTPQRKKITDLQ